MRDDVSNNLNRQAMAAAELVKALQSDDEDLTHDMVEGETSFFEAVEAALNAINECEILAVGIGHAEKKLADRKERVTNRANKLRGLIDQAFQIAEVKSHVFPTATITTKKVPQKLIVTDEAAIPSKYFTPQPPKLDRKALLADVKEAAVSGTELSNGGTTIQIRSN